MRARDPLAVALRTALAVCAGCGWLAASIVLLDHLEPPGTWLRAILCLAWLVFAPLYEAEVADLLGRVPAIGSRLARLVWVLEVLPVFLLPTPIADALIFGSMVLAQGHLFLAGEDDRNAARCLAAAPLVNVIALAYAPSVALLCLLPLSGLAAFTALVLLGGRATRRRVRRGVPVVEQGASVRGRLAYALPFGALGLGGATLLFVAITAALGTGEAPEPAPATLARGPGRPASLPAGHPGGAGDTRGGFSPEMAFSGSASMPFSEEVVLYLTPGDGAPGAGLVHLRDMVLDTFVQDTVRLGDRSLPPTHSDEHDGERDGWTWVVPRTRGLRTRGYQVESRRLFLSAQAEWTLVFGPHPLAAVELASVDYHPDQVLFTHEPLPGWFRYRLKVVERDTSVARLRDLDRSRGVDRRYLALPPGSPAMDEIADLALAWSAGARSDYEKVQAIVEHLRSEFDYELRELDFKGPDALLQFLHAQRGYCTYFATAAALMLRCRGIPTRVATGFLAHEWEPDRERWVVRERDAHAWLEVAFEEVGWVTFDPTPPAARRIAAGAGARTELEQRVPWEERVSAALESWLDQGGSLGQLLGALFSAPRDLARRVPALWLLPSALVLIALHLILRRRAEVRGDEGPPGLPRATSGLFRRLSNALASHGHLRRPSQTPREFARAVAAASPGAAFAAVGEATELYYRARYGARPLAPEDEHFVEGLIRDLLAGR